MRRRFVLFAFSLTLAGLALTAKAAQAEVVRYMSRHPLPKRVGHGFCDIDVPHFHDYPPSDPRLYRQQNGEYYFVGDPTPFGYDGPRYAFYGPHPIEDAGVSFGGPAYCYIRGPHYHWYAPPAQAPFEMRGGAYWYVGAYDPVFYDDQPRFVVINDFYSPLVYSRPIVDIRIAPPAFRGEIVVGGGPGGWRTVREGPEFRRGPDFRGPGARFDQRREMAMHERREQLAHREDEKRGWDRDRRGGPERGGWHGGPPPERGGGWHGGPPPGQRSPGGPGGWRPGPAQNNGGGWHGGSPGGPRPGGGQRNGFHR